jgi:hypothetical protein
LVLGFAVVFWAVFEAFWTAPLIGGTDAYLFMDAAVNFAHGLGFTTSSFEHSASFVPVLYSSYTPGFLWAFLPFVKVIGDVDTARNIFVFLLASVSVLFAARSILRATLNWRLRSGLLLMLALAIPVGVVGGSADRPETLSFLVLLIFIALFAQPTEKLWWRGIVGGVLFLIQPFAGVIAVSLISINVLLQVWQDWGSAKRVLGHGILAAVCFSIPILGTAAAFYNQDSKSIDRFKAQAISGGLQRTGNYTAAGTTVDTPNDAEQRSGNKYASAIKSILTQTEKVSYFAGWLTSLCIWFGLLCFSRNDLRAAAALAMIGVPTLLLPFLLFPLQGHYTLLGRSIFPFILSADVFGCSRGLRLSNAPAIIVGINLAFLMPALFFSLTQRIETKSSYLEASAQVDKLHQYLRTSKYSQGVVLVPSTHYFIYKSRIQNLFNPGYLSRTHGIADVAAVVNCPMSSNFSDGLAKPLLPLIRGTGLKVLDSITHPQTVRLFGKTLMKRNWTWGCTVYVRQSSPSQ